MLCILAVRFSPRDTVETTDGAIDVVRARERPVLVEDAPGTHELGLAWGSSAGGMSCAPDVTPAPLGTGAAHLVIERVEVLGAIDRTAVEAHRLLARFPCCALLLESNRPLGRALRGPRLRNALPLPLGPIRLIPATFLLVPCAALRAGATGPRIGSSFRAAALSAHLRPQPHSRAARQVPQIPFAGRCTWRFLFLVSTRMIESSADARDPSRPHPLPRGENQRTCANGLIWNIADGAGPNPEGLLRSFRVYIDTMVG